MERILRRWMWRFIAVAAALTLVLSLAAGVVLRRAHAGFTPWIDILVAGLSALVSAGVLLPGMQRDLRRDAAARPRTESGEQR